MNSDKAFKKLNIFDYKNGIYFLTDYYKQQKKIDPQFNYDQWSYALGFKSRSFMYLICSQKRRLSTDSSLKLSNYFKFTEKEYEHFVLITDHDSMNLSVLKEAFQDKILEKFSFDEQRFDQDKYSFFLSSPTMPLVRTMLAFPDFLGTKRNILQYIRIDHSQLDADLNCLIELGMIEQVLSNDHDDIVYRALSKNYKFPDAINNSAITNYHENVLNEAVIMNRQEQLNKSLRSLIFALNEKNFDSLSEEIESFVTKIKNKYSSLEIKQSDLFRMNLQLYQVSKKSPL